MSFASLHALRDRRFVAILLLGFSSGLPFALVGATLSRWLAERAISTGTIGLFGYVALPYALKFLWAPVIDRARLPPFTNLFGRRRGWGLAIQAGLALAIFALGLADPAAHLMRLAALGLLVSFLSASQDIVIDALRVEMLERPEYGMGSAVIVLGYRFGMLASGAGALYIAAWAAWPTAYAAMAVLVGLGALGVLIAPEPAYRPVAGERFAQRFRLAVIDPLADLLARPRWPAMLAFVLLYKLGAELAQALLSKFYFDLGFSKPEVASMTKVFGVVALIAGGFAGGYAVKRLGIRRALLIGGIAQTIAQLGFAWLATRGHSLAGLAAAVGCENFTSAIATSAFVAYLSGLCRRDYTATQYALLSALFALSSRLISGPSGYLQAAVGWQDYFLLSLVAAVPGLLLLGCLRETDTPPTTESRALP